MAGPRRLQLVHGWAGTDESLRLPRVHVPAAAFVDGTQRCWRCGEVLVTRAGSALRPTELWVQDGPGARDGWALGRVARLPGAACLEVASWTYGTLHAGDGRTGCRRCGEPLLNLRHAIGPVLVLVAKGSAPRRLSVSARRSEPAPGRLPTYRRCRPAGSAATWRRNSLS